jgi:hypothetical protein
MGYDIVLSKAGSCRELLRLIPILEEDVQFLRQWTVRIRSGGKVSEPFLEITPPPDMTSIGLQYGADLQLSGSRIQSESAAQCRADDVCSLDFPDFLFDS